MQYKNFWAKSANLLVFLNPLCNPQTHWAADPNSSTGGRGGGKTVLLKRTCEVSFHLYIRSRASLTAMQTFQKRDYQKPQAWTLPASSTYFRGLSLLQHLAHLGWVPAFCEEAALHWSHGLCSILHVGAREEELFGNMYRFQGYWVGLQIPSCITKLALNWHAKQLSIPERYTYLTRSGLRALLCCSYSHWAWQDLAFGLPDLEIKPAFK